MGSNCGRLKCSPSIEVARTAGQARVMSILNTSLSGMMANTNWLTAIAQNVANANTTGYKNVQTSFSALVNSSENFDSQFSGVTASVRPMNSLQGQDMQTSSATDLAS